MARRRHWGHFRLPWMSDPRLRRTSLRNEQPQERSRRRGHSATDGPSMHIGISQDDFGHARCQRASINQECRNSCCPVGSSSTSWPRDSRWREKSSSAIGELEKAKPARTTSSRFLRGTSDLMHRDKYERARGQN